MTRRLLRPAAAAMMLLAVSAAPGHATRIQGHLVDCGGKMCPWFQAIVDAPKGWGLDKDESLRHRVAIYFPEGPDDPAKGVMYIKAAREWEKQPLDGFIAGAQEEWLKVNPTSKVERLEDVRRDGKPAIQLYLYRNPSQPRQAFELTAFVKISDNSYQEANYFLQAVLSAPSMQAIDAARPAFMELLQRL